MAILIAKTAKCIKALALNEDPLLIAKENYFRERYSSSGVCVFGILMHIPVKLRVNPSGSIPLSNTICSV
jgi:hypothetical protein